MRRSLLCGYHYKTILILNSTEHTNISINLLAVLSQYGIVSIRSCLELLLSASTMSNIA